MPAVRLSVNWGCPWAPAPGATLPKRKPIMRSIILWIIGVPVSVILLIGLFTHF
jgi:hypothetical protein